MLLHTHWEQVKAAKYRQIQKDGKRRQRQAVQAKALAQSALAVQQTESNGEHHHHDACPGAQSAHTQPPCNGHGKGNATHQGATKQRRHAQDHGACVEKNPWHDDYRNEHAQNTETAKHQAGSCLACQSLLLACPYRRAVHKAQRQHQGQPFDGFYEHGVGVRRMRMNLSQLLLVVNQVAILVSAERTVLQSCFSRDAFHQF